MITPEEIQRNLPKLVRWIIQRRNICMEIGARLSSEVTRDAQTIGIGQIDEVRIMVEGEISLPIEPELLQLIHALSPGARLRNITYLRAPLMIIHPVMNPPITAPTMAAQNSFQLRNQEKKCSKRCKACTVSFIRNWPVHFEFNAIFDTAWNGDNPSERQPDVSRTFKLPRE